MKIVVFDLDETMGYFIQFGIFWNCLGQYIIENKIGYILDQPDFNMTLDLYPEFLRPHIIDILKYLKKKKENKRCQKMMIYTNNQAPKSWCQYIITYLESKLDCKLIDHVINAFKINGEVVELCRTTHTKTYSDFIKCTQLPKHCKICFVDDIYHQEMTNKNVYYINIKPYIYDLEFSEILNRFWNAGIREKILTNDFEKDFYQKMTNYFKYINFNVIQKSTDEYDIDKILSKQILVHLQKFFKRSPLTHTRNHKKIKTNETLKNAKF